MVITSTGVLRWIGTLGSVCISLCNGAACAGEGAGPHAARSGSSRRKRHRFAERRPLCTQKRKHRPECFRRAQRSWS